MHSFRIFAACALLAAGCPRWLIKRMLRWRGDDLSVTLLHALHSANWRRIVWKPILPAAVRMRGCGAQPREKILWSSTVF